MTISKEDESVNMENNNQETQRTQKQKEIEFKEQEVREQRSSSEKKSKDKVIAELKEERENLHRVHVIKEPNGDKQRKEKEREER
ncbi:MAG TPA: hypothetical protein EYH09_00020 [Candidatus Nanopusillus sp.]|nr:hypothetical protein [Candidatus Nanopusillus sp.]